MWRAARIVVPAGIIARALLATASACAGQIVPPPAVAIEDASQSAIHRAVWEKDIEAVKKALQSGADVNALMGGDDPDFAGATPLMLAVRLNWRPCTELLLQAGAEVNAADQDGATALHHAAQANAIEAIEVLLTAGANVNA